MTAIKGGQTASVNMFYGNATHELFGADAALRAYADIGFRGAFGLVSRDQNRYVHEPDEQFLGRLPADLANEVRASGMGYANPVVDVFDAFEVLARRWQDYDDRLRVIVAPDWTPACSDDLYRRCRAAADEYATGITSHVLETRAEMLYNLNTHGVPAVVRLDRLGVLGPDFTAAHFVWATDEDIAVFADSGAVASNNPGSNLRLCTGICRTRDILDRGGRVGFGTDNISYSDSEDFFQELRLAGHLQRLPMQFDVGRLDSERLLRAAGENGARATGFEGRIGALAPNRFADLLVVRRNRIFSPVGRYDRSPVLDVIIDRANASDLDTVLIHGQIVLDQGRMTTVDEDELLTRLADTTTRLYTKSPAGERLWELGDLVKPTVKKFYGDWYNVPVEPAYTYNAASVTTGAAQKDK
jgi:5-methylthioadenosine/S-adenosylhomocysteine deaminase